VVIDEDIPAEMDIVPIVAGKDGQDDRSFSDRTDELAQPFVQSLLIRTGETIVMRQEFLRVSPVGRQFGIRGPV
jgi:hypothetical protein